MRKALEPGHSIGHQNGYAGTLGCLVEVNTHEGIMPGFLSSAHVLSMLNTAVAGDEDYGDPIIHPGVPDGPKTAANRVGYLYNYTYLTHYQKRRGSVSSPNDVDVALVVADEHKVGANYVPHIDGSSARKRLGDVVPLEGLVDYKEADVYKIGRTTGLTKGSFVGIEVRDSPVKLPDGRVYLYSYLLVIKAQRNHAFSQAGDSGSVVYASDYKPLGLIVGGNDQFSFASPLSTCLDTMSAELA